MRLSCRHSYAPKFDARIVAVVNVERSVRADYASRDIGPALAAANERGGSWELVGRLGHGAWGGAWRVRDAAGRVAVLKCVWDTDWRGRLESASCAVELLYERGAPADPPPSPSLADAVATWYSRRRGAGEHDEESSPGKQRCLAQ
jgi:hypothetical protein